MNIGLNDLLRISPMIALFLTSLLPISMKVLRGNKEQNPLLTLGTGLLGILVTAGLLIIFAGDGQMAFSKALIFDGITSWIGFIALIVTAGAMILAYESISTNSKQFSEYIFLLCNSALGMLVLIAGSDLLVMFIGLEIMSLALYLMIAMSNEEKLAKEASFKYFLLGSLASAILLYGIAMIFGSTGTTYISDIIEKVPLLAGSHRLFLFGMAMIIFGFCFKVSIVPFHAWTPDVYQGAPTPLSAYMSTAVKAASFAAFLRIISLKALVTSVNLFDVLQWLAVATMILGNVAAIRQENFKRMLAYSSVAHSGYIMVGLIATGISAQSAQAASSVIFYLIGYAVMTFGSFAIVSLFEKSENTVLNVEDMAGIARKRPWMAFALTVFLLSLAGVPPTIGFFGKFYLFTTAIGEGLLWLALWGVINSVISVYYYLRPIVVMYMKEGTETDAHHPLNATRMTIVFSMVLVMTLGFVSDFIFKAVEKSLF